MSHFLHSTAWTVGGLLAVLWIGVMLTALPAAARISAEKTTQQRRHRPASPAASVRQPAHLDTPREPT